MKEEIHITDGLPHSNTVEELINVIWDMEKDKEELIKEVVKHKTTIAYYKVWLWMALWLGFSLGLALHYLNWL